jgi:aminomethyltransferase
MLSAWFAERGVAQRNLPGGLAIPLRFSDSREEHLATRRSAGLFDFSFMGGWEITGRDALAFLQRLQTRDVRLLQRGRLAYTLLCRDDGSVLVDATIWCHERSRYWIFTGRRSDHSHIASVASGFNVNVTVLLPEFAVIALQGPSSFGLVERFAPRAAVGLPHFGFRRSAIARVDTWIGRLGYTGELGYEILMHTNEAVIAWKRIMESANPGEIMECGWESANSLRIEAGFIHFDYELAGKVFPDELSIGRLMMLNQSDFIGREALLSLSDRPPGRRLAGIAIDHQRDHVPAELLHFQPIAHTTSEAFSPVFERQLALAFIDVTLPTRSVIYTGTGLRGRVVKLPFFDPLRAVPRRAPYASKRQD